MDSLPSTAASRCAGSRRAALGLLAALSAALSAATLLLPLDGPLFAAVARDALPSGCTDADADGYSPDGDPCGPIDCADDNAAIHPGAAEVCNGTDDDCNGTSDDEPTASASCATDCTATAVCAVGSCETTARTCDDVNPCTIDRCTLGLGCEHTAQPNGLSCSDGNPCNGEELCGSGVCMPGAALDCKDGNACTVDSCAAPNGCRNVPIPGCCTSDADCVDISACTVQERCVSGLCTSDPVPCDDANSCTVDTCDPALGCVHTPVINGIACGDGNVCNGIETCQGGDCAPGQPPGCDDGNACTVDGCDALSGCTHQQTPGCCTIDADCADTSACTVNERCDNRACVSDPLACGDGNPCTIDSCDPQAGCRFTGVPNGEACGALDFCAGLETCQAGRCAPGHPPNCDDANICTTDGCSPDTGCVHTPVAGCCVTNGDCVDDNLCTTNERCVGNACTASPVDCDDSNPCTLDSCSPATGCVHTPVLDGGSCADAAACDGLETCAGGSCVPGTPLTCDDGNACTNDSCDNITGCLHTPRANCCNADSECADTDLCTTNERCTAAHACASTAIACGDGNVCTGDTCNPQVGCQHLPVTGGSCSDGNACTSNDSCLAGGCVGSARQCADGNLCNGVESCDRANGQCTLPATDLICTPGSRRPTSCNAEWYADVPNNPKGVLATVKECAQGDASCDHDSDPSTCTFRVGICFRIMDPRLLVPCLPGYIVSYRLLRPNLVTSAAATTALQSALLALPGAAVSPTAASTITYEPPLGATHCTAEVPIVVRAGAKLKVRGRTVVSAGGVDTDALLLFCRR